MSATPTRVVLTPDVIGTALVEGSSTALLRLWRDGVIQPVVNRPLLRRYLTLLDAMGLPAEQTRRWSWWLGACSKVLFVDDHLASGVTGAELCHAIAAASGAQYVLFARGEGVETTAPADVAHRAPWLKVSAFLRAHTSNDQSSPGSSGAR